ncbi:hypothetical protein ABB37_02637 [Leptomonas pyrrhocoris]|uniref:Uncharacterized protein n=1 Tax=Leptomonas pyrrhocoris TaxID=157538 RepID=A0A0M9G5R3_LEPPY|nr:hypothetical protein ABB37_02637 [Leptomonas pyrrhocoris]XP_015661313.1 hypothetical protein ABB37_02637 [Leptomonas pyrrhocoris]XP_015661314.1 hypothetical protein ABB37_02637 [Leptomonas pyrrhocoris]XP_015661315.1 hypothetical protein ABB37_02637 [Leptomonas pyrrhocoris]XP_015661316.1 hypothetical protein ABB37_02637 [Leptomonas pyrrhocoris]XP_015661317.1 hypothetical protein ABB37_02637 [Leptomonas pyrrhocoris]KPA82873.1 hypothetical protein ABB37_02637 [Leptomonas pyrrhocoris]KPA82874|eukprot:XP_015661312.1 hypothetical protein ABB37_02637 [Leptomonas pyrrhocoris]
MSNWNEDYEDDFEEEVSTHSKASSSTAAALARDNAARLAPAPTRQFSVANSFDSYESSGEGQVFASSAHELDASSSQASSRHSDPMYPTEAAKRPVLQQQEGAYPTEARAARSSSRDAAQQITSSSRFSSSKAASSKTSSSSRKATPPRQSPPYAQAAAPSYESSKTSPADTPGRAAPQPSYLRSASTSSSGVTPSDSSREYAAHKSPQQQQLQQYYGVPRSSTSVTAAGKQSGSNSPGPIQGTLSAAMMVMPNTRDVSGPRRTPLDGGANTRYTVGKKRSIHQSNYTSVEELDDEPLPHHKGRPPNMHDEELSDVEDEEVNNARRARYTPEESMKRESTAVAPPPPPIRSPTPSVAASSDKKPSPQPASNRSRSEQGHAATALKNSTDEERKGTKATPVEAPLPGGPRSKRTSTFKASPSSDSKNSTTPYSGPGPQKILREPSPTSSSADSADDKGGAGEERATLLLRIADLQMEIGTWDNRIERKRALMAANATPKTALSPSLSPSPSRSPTGRSPQRGNSRAPPAAAHRKAPLGRGRGINGNGNYTNDAKARPITKARLEALREKNAKLEAAYTRRGADGTGAVNIDVPALVSRADAQLQKARARLKEVTVVRRALENRDKRAAHTIEEVNRRMPTAIELQDRQMNEGIYSRAGLQRSLQELKSSIERTRGATQLMEAKCAELSAQVQERQLSSITPKEYNALRSDRDAKRKTAEKHRAAIAVYSAAAGLDPRGGTAAALNGGGGGASGRSSRSTSPRKSSMHGKKKSILSELTTAEQQLLADYETGKTTLLDEERATVDNRRQELQSSIDDLRRRIQQRTEQIKANHDNVSEGTAGDAAAHGVEGETKASGTRAGSSGATAVAQKSSLRNVIQAPLGNGTRERGRASLSRERPGASPPAPPLEAGVGRGARNSAAAERLRGAVAAARKNRQRSPSQDYASASATPQKPQHGVPSTEPPTKKNPNPLPPSTGTGQRTVREAHQPSSSAFTALADSPVKHTTLGGHALSANGGNAGGAGNTSLEKLVDEAGDVRHLRIAAATAAEEIDLDDDGDVEAMLRKIDEDNRRIGEAALGRASQSPQREEHNRVGTAGKGRGIYKSAGEHEVYPSPSSAHRAQQATSHDEIGDIPEDEDVDAGEGSGRSTPEWLREA